MKSATEPSRPSRSARIKGSPPDLHDRPLLRPNDTVAIFNLVIGKKLTGEDKHDLIAFLRSR
jgi:hypothetical protein